ncbi:MAG TPA: adenylyl-sulfate kinase [Ignavibacteria bacterium]|nr:adenylyl-sulfate kinase [Ignavibacteria bacterium]
MTNSNIIPQKHHTTKEDRNKLTNNRSILLWFTGLSGSGKSTLANLVEQKLIAGNILSYILDGDNIRTGLNSDLDFSESGRNENIRRIGQVSRLMTDAGVVVITAFISPFRKERDSVRKLFGRDEFFEIYIKCDLEECEKRDVKGLYSKARSGVIKDFTGIDSPYEEPENPELIIDTTENSIEESAEIIYRFIEPKLRIKD